MTVAGDIRHDRIDVLKAALGTDLQREFVKVRALNLYRKGKLTIPEVLIASVTEDFLQQHGIAPC